MHTSSPSSPHGRSYLDHRVRYGLDHGPDGPDWRDLAVFAAAVVVLLALLALAGCSGGAPAVADLGKHTAGALAGGAKPGSFAAGAAVALGNAESGSDWLTLIGGLALVAGGVCVGHPNGPNGLGFGLLAGAFCCLLAGAVLPLLAGWVGLALCVLVLAGFASAKLGLLSRLKTLVP